jgi:tetratricopeptide (TPR) repeat protein
MMGNYDMAWHMTQELLEEMDSYNLYHLYNYITFATPFLECDHTPVVWFRKTYDYLEYIRQNTSLNSDEPTSNSEDSDDELLESNDNLIDTYGNLGCYFWYTARDCHYALSCFQQQMNLLKSRMINTRDETNDIDLGIIYQRMANVYCEIDIVKGLELYGQAIDIFSKHEKSCSVELAVCYSKIAYFQDEMCLEYFQRAFNLFLMMTDSCLYDLNIDGISECYFYLAKKYATFSLSNHRQMALKWSQLALRLYLMTEDEKVDRELDDYVELLSTIRADMNR